MKGFRVLEKGTKGSGVRGAHLRFLGEEARRVAAAMERFRARRLARVAGARAPRTVPGSWAWPRGRRPSLPLSEESGGALGFSPFYYYPFLFATAFPPVPLSRLRLLALSNRILLEALLLADQHVDQGLAWTPERLFLVDACYQGAVELLLPLFPLHHPFWGKATAWFARSARAVIREHAMHRFRVGAYEREAFVEISTGKTALIKTTLFALSSLSGTSAPFSALALSQDRFLTGFQYLDDLRDWREDLRHRNFTFLLTRALREGGLAEQIDRAEPCLADRVGRVLYHGGLAEAQLGEAEACFAGALQAVKEIPVPLWTEVVQGFRDHCDLMRRDLAEIRRRGAARRRSRPPVRSERDGRTIEEAIDRGLAFLARHQPPHGGFPLARGTSPYMGSAQPAGPSRFVTHLLLGSLGPLRARKDFPQALTRKALGWLSHPSPLHASSLPSSLEEAFPAARPSRASILRLDAAFVPAPLLAPSGLFWAALFHAAAEQDVIPPNLASFVRASLQEASFSCWTGFASHPAPSSPRRGRRDDPSPPAFPGGADEPQAPPPPDTPGPSFPAAGARGRGPGPTVPSPGKCRPLLPLLLLSTALPPGFPRAPLHAYLLHPSRRRGSWTHPTETALSLVCLLSTGYEGPEIDPAAQKLLQGQEPDGSWPPNAVYEEEGKFYGGRELTTAWALHALLLALLRSPTNGGRGGKEGYLHGRRGRPTEILLHEGLPPRLRRRTLDVLRRLAHFIPPPWPDPVALGRWEVMPPHFILKDGRGACFAGINLGTESAPRLLSTAGRPFEVETVLAVVAGARLLARGPIKDRLERLYVTGLALQVAARIWPRIPPWERLGMNRTDWRWCVRNTAFLWEEVRRFLLSPRRGPEFRWLLPDSPSAPPSPIPRGAGLFLGEALFDSEPPEERAGVSPLERLRTDRAEIIRTFRRKVSLGTSLDPRG